MWTLVHAAQQRLAGIQDGLEIEEIFSVTIKGVTNNVDLDHLRSDLDQY